MSNVKNKTKYLFLLMFGLIIYSNASILSKLASNESFLSLEYILFFLLIIFLLFIYAIIWQQVLKHIELSIAMSFKPLVIILNVLIASLIFKENITIKMSIGIVLVVIGIFVVVKND